MTIEDFIGVKVWYDSHGQMIWGTDKDGAQQRILDVRGWGAIQNMFIQPGGAIDLKKAAKFQDDLGQWIVDAINTKLKGPSNV